MKTLAAALAALSFSLATAPAGAQRRPASLRVLGFGTGFGVGYDVNSFGGDHAWPLLPTLSLHVALTPRVELDFVLVSQEIEVTDFRIPDVRYSDHRPIVCDFRVRSRVSGDRLTAA
jgi:glucokinase